MSSKRKIILLVDDEYFFAELIKARLESVGYQVVLAENGVRALDILKHESVDLVLMDVMMPEMDGWEATKRIRSDPKLKNLPIIFLTARARHEDHLKANEVGGNDYVSKPFEAEELLEAISKWI